MRILIGVLLLTCVAAPARAQSLYGPGGLFLHPSASVPDQSQLTPGLLLLPQHHPVAHSTRTWISGSLDYGLTKRLEVGASVVKVAGWQRDASYGGFAKYLLLTESKQRPALAIGFTQTGFGNVNTREAFLAAKKQVRGGKEHPVTLHLGVQYADEVDGLSRHEFQPFGGVEVGLAHRLSFIAEGRPRMNAEFGTPLALTLAYRPMPRWRLALTWANNGLSDKPMFGFGAGLALGGRK